METLTCHTYLEILINLRGWVNDLVLSNILGSRGTLSSYTTTCMPMPCSRKKFPSHDSLLTVKSASSNRTEPWGFSQDMAETRTLIRVCSIPSFSSFHSNVYEFWTVRFCSVHFN